MESREESPPLIYPRMSMNPEQALDVEASTSKLQSQSSHSAKDNELYEEVKNKINHRSGQKIRFVLCVSLLVVVVLALIVSLAILLTTKRSIALPTNPNHTDSLATYSKRVATAPENEIKAVGYGDVIMNLFAGEPVQPWVLESSHGNCSLESKRFIIAQPSGKYHISCKVELRKKAANLKLKMIRNGVPITIGNFVEGTGKPLISNLEEKIYLKKGDRLSITAGNNAAVLMKRDTSHFQLKQILE